ncbi:MAG: hypothetical protein HYR72_15325 [Deltaproteobacteria bacterium]|nr:hypothetical protein [Deltaproteobacteria bacterium]MBI3390172.1 hypothetical protein [Deltaproteobacteria bacterium]
MNRLLKLTSIIEAGTGLALIAAPSVFVWLLLGSEISGASVSIGRVAGIGLLSLGVACWPSPDASVANLPALRAMLTYNPLVTIYLLSLGVDGERVGYLLWPAVVAHAVLTFLLGRAWITNRHRRSEA